MDEKFLIASNIRSLRLHNGLTQEQIAAKLHVSRSAYCQYESGKRTPDFSVLCSIAKLYSVTVDSLFKDFCSPIPLSNYSDSLTKLNKLTSLYMALSKEDQDKIEHLLYSLYLTDKKEPPGISN